MDIKEQLVGLDSCQEQMITQLIDWCQINSGTYHLAGIKTLQEKIINLFTQLDCSLQIYPTQPYTSWEASGKKIQHELGSVLCFQKRPQAALQILLGGHCDTVYGKDHEFQKCHWLDEQTLFGPGVADMKGGLLVIYYALQVLEHSPLAGNIGWKVFINADEEIGSIGSAPILEQISQGASLAFLYEPSLNEQGVLAGERKGSGNFTIIVQGKAAHVGRAFQEGRNAIVAAAKVVAAINALNEQFPTLIVNVGAIQGGGVLNQVPEQAIICVNVRTTTKKDEEQFLQALNKVITLHQSQDIKISIEGFFTRKPKQLNGAMLKLYDWLKERGKEIDLPISWQATGGCCDGNNLSQLGIPNIDTLGVRGGALHSAQEYVKVASLVERAKLSAFLLLKLAQQGLNI